MKLTRVEGLLWKLASQINCLKFAPIEILSMRFPRFGGGIDMRYFFFQEGSSPSNDRIVINFSARFGPAQTGLVHGSGQPDR